MRDLVAALLETQRLSGFADLAGARAAATIPIADRLVNEFISRILPSEGSVQQVVLSAKQGNEIVVDIRMAAGPLTLPLSVTVEIESQPTLAERPVLGLRVKNGPRLLVFSRMLRRFFNVLPRGIAVDRDRVELDLREFLPPDTYGVLQHVRELSVTTTEGVVIVSVRADIEPRRM